MSNVWLGQKLSSEVKKNGVKSNFDLFSKYGLILNNFHMALILFCKCPMMQDKSDVCDWVCQIFSCSSLCFHLLSLF